MREDYAQFLASKAPRAHASGIEPSSLPDHLFDFQQACVAFTIRQGRAGLYLDCVAGETLVETMAGPVRIDRLARDGSPIIVKALADGVVVNAPASSPFKKGMARLYTVNLRSGRKITATAGHRFLTPSGWRACGELRARDVLLVSDACRPPSTLGFCPSTSRVDDLHLRQRPQDWPDHYASCGHQCGGQLLTAGGSDPIRAPSQAGVPILARSCSHEDDLAHRRKHSRLHQGTFRPSMPGSLVQDSYISAEPECRAYSCNSAPPALNSRSASQAGADSILLHTACEALELECLLAGVPSSGLLCDPVVSIQYSRTDDYFDLHVPGYENYFANGVCSHNTGLGKTRCQLEWARQSAEASNGRALILTPLAVARQIEREGQSLGYNCRVIREAADAKNGINICNYDRLEKIEPDSFGAVSLDESSILKAFGGKTTRALIDIFAAHRFRLSATATPAPNDHMELGNQAEFLGLMSAQEMLMRWFINDTATASQQWRLKGHAEQDFWDWMSSWSRMAQSPEDLGFDGSRFKLPPLNIIRHRSVGSNVKAPEGSLFASDVSATNMHDVKRQTSGARADAVAALATSSKEPWVVWCDTDYEADALAARLPDFVEVRGSMPIDRKEENLEAFSTGKARGIITKPSVAGYGLNWQHCRNMAFAGRTFSYELWYQAVRRSWRFGQTKQVNVHLIVAEGEDQIGRVIDRKAEDHASMKAAMASAMKRANASTANVRIPYQPTHKAELPAWL